MAGLALLMRPRLPAAVPAAPKSGPQLLPSDRPFGLSLGAYRGILW